MGQLPASFLMAWGVVCGVCPPPLGGRGQVEVEVKRLVEEGNVERVDAIISLLVKDFALSSQADHRKGARGLCPPRPGLAGVPMHCPPRPEKPECPSTGQVGVLIFRASAWLLSLVSTSGEPWGQPFVGPLWGTNAWAVLTLPASSGRVASSAWQRSRPGLRSCAAPGGEPGGPSEEPWPTCQLRISFWACPAGLCVCCG